MHLQVITQSVTKGKTHTVVVSDRKHILQEIGGNQIMLCVIMNHSANLQIPDNVHGDLAKFFLFGGGGGGGGSGAYEKGIKAHLLFSAIMNRIFQFHIYCSCSISR